jgi:hypothetical protein
MIEAGTFDPRTPVFGIFECWKCHAQRPILVRKSDRRGGDRVFRCRVCRAKADVKWLNGSITFQAYLDQLPKEESE